VGDLDTVFRSWQELALVSAVLGFAQMVYVMFGFGAGLIAVGTLAAILPDIQDVVVLLLLVSFPSEMIVVFTSWRTIRWKGITRILVGVAIGIPLGTWLLGLGETLVVLAVLAVVLVLVGTGLVALPRHRAITWPAWAEPPLGLVSGVLGGLYGTGGPPLIFYFQLRRVEKAAFRAHLMAIFLALTIVRLPSYAFSGLITEQRILSALAVAPAVLVGAFVGHRLHVEVAEETFRRMVAIALIVIGLVLVARCFTGAW